MRGRDIETGGDYDVPSPLSSFQKTFMPKTELEDVTMTDQAPTEVHVQGRHSDDTAEIQLISEYEYKKPHGTSPDSHLLRTLRSANKRQERNVKKQKTTIKGLEEAADNLEEDLADADLHLQSCQSELEGALKKLAASERALQGTKAQLTQQRATCRLSAKDLAASRREMRDLKAIIRNLEASNGDLHDKLAASQGELSRCKDDLFSLQTVAQTPDSTISWEFESVGQQIIHWIEAEVAAFEKAHPEESPDHIFSVGQDKHASSFLRLNPGAGEHLVRFLIHQFLQDNLFGKRMYFLGLKDETAHMLRRAESTMASLDPPRDSATIAIWRSETLKALYATTECKDNSKRQVEDLNWRLFRELSRSLPIIFSDRERTRRFFTQVMLPAAKLAATIQSSASNYEFDDMSMLPTIFKPVIADDLKLHKMIDIKSGRNLKPDSTVVADTDGIIGRFIMVLEPGLYRRIDDTNTTLRQTMLLVELNHPLAKRSKATA